MIKDSPAVEDIRRIRCALSEQFDHDVEKYIDYLQSKYESSGQIDIVNLRRNHHPIQRRVINTRIN